MNDTCRSFVEAEKLGRSQRHDGVRASQGLRSAYYALSTVGPRRAYAAGVLDHPLSWTKMRQVYALSGLVKRWGPDAVNTAYAWALQAEAVNVGLVGRMLGRAEAEAATPATAAAPALAQSGPARFARSPDDFAFDARRAAGGAQ